MGIISPFAIKEFIKRPRDSHAWMKKLPEAELDAALKELKFKPANPAPLDKHQKICVLLGIAYKQFAFWLDMGLGKTRIALELLRYWHQQGELHTAIVLAPSESVLIGWENQIKEWRLGLPHLTLLNSSSNEKWDHVSEFEGGVILATYPGLVRMVTGLQEVTKGRRTKRKLVINKALIKRLAKTVSALVMDEATKGANKGSLNYRVCNQISKFASVRYELAGRPFGRDPTALWSQLYLIDRGETLGETLGMFRAAFFRTDRNRWGGFDYKFRKDLKPTLNRILRHRSITYAEAETGITRKVVNSLEEVILPEEAKIYYERFVKELKRKHAGFQERKNSFLRMRQVSSGFVGFLDDDTGDRAEIAFAVNPKLDRLMELIDQVPRKRKFVVFHEFTYSGTMICEALQKAGIKHVRGWGGTKSAREFQDAFDNDDSVRGAVLSHKWGAYGLNMQRGNFAFIYESPVPVIDNEQMRKRLPRKGQLHTVFEYDLVCRGTVDTRILAFHAEGADLFKAIIQNPSGVL